MKKNSVIDVKGSSAGDNRFRRYEYWGLGQKFVLHYMGDDTVFKGFEHRNSKHSRKPFVRNAPLVKNKVHSNVIQV